MHGQQNVKICLLIAAGDGAFRYQLEILKFSICSHRFHSCPFLCTLFVCSTAEKSGLL